MSAETQNSEAGRDGTNLQMSVAMQWLGSRQVMTATDMHATTEELLEGVFAVRSVPRLYNNDQLQLPVRPSRQSRVCLQAHSQL
jgi:hypothetical protein